MFGWVKNVGKFIGRQARTKTGKFGITVGATVLSGLIGGDELAAKAPHIVEQVYSVVSDPTNALYGLGLMYLRDKEAKAEALKRERLKK